MSSEFISFLAGPGRMCTGLGIHVSVIIIFVYVSFFSGSNSMLDLLVEYFKWFGDKPTCFWDLAAYLHLNLQELSEREKVRQLSLHLSLKWFWLLCTWALGDLHLSSTEASFIISCRLTCII